MSRLRLLQVVSLSRDAQPRRWYDDTFFHEASSIEPCREKLIFVRMGRFFPVFCMYWREFLKVKQKMGGLASLFRRVPT